MPPATQAVVSATMAWLRSSQHVEVPLAWLETCVDWVQEEGGGGGGGGRGGRLTQQQINQQVLDQWLLADLRDLGHPVLPGGLSRAQKTELSGTFCVQVDSLLDISQPAYGQLQTLRGKDCTNEEVTAVTQATQRPWEARPTRMLLLQVTDGVQNLEAMEYQPISALNTSLRPGVKLRLQGQMVCRLGVLLLGPHNVKVLGGEVEDLVDRNNQSRVLCRALGIPVEELQNGGAAEGNPAAPQQENPEMEDLDDQELLASLEAQEELDRGLGSAVMDSGFGTGSSLSNPPLSRSESSSTTSHGRHPVHAGRNGLGDSGGDSVLSDPPSSLRSNQHEEEHFLDEDFDDLPLDELDGLVFQEGPNETVRLNSPQSHSETRGQSNSSAPSSLMGAPPPASGPQRDASRSRFSGLREEGETRPGRSGADKRQLAPVVTSKPSMSSPGIPEDSCILPDVDLMEVDVDYCFLEEMDTAQSPRGGAASGPPLQKEDLTFTNAGHKRPACLGPTRGGTTGGSTDGTRGPAMDTPSAEPAAHNSRPSGNADALPALTSPPFTYLKSLQAELPEPQQRHGTSVRIKAFIVTLLGKLTSGAGAWRVRATVSDGTGYLDVELADRVLAGLLGFTVAQKGAMKRDPSRRAELDAGMRRCQEEMVDMCCVMTLAFEEQGSKAVVTRVDAVTEEDLAALERRVRGK
ncbi:RecQ-mediated genome instability protein 1 [Merluccius polli]|uniref:RecQ-mediated genome instability protein 1 n=1 Tax=Merluccius polli TaxID=89951 RepID=A0AA47M9T2_MERPO|nr:RecQ-mediated genome instability protein 1 [Merluccius polli]